MPKRISRPTHHLAKSVQSEAKVASEFNIGPRDRESFDLGDVVVERRSPHRLGRICEVGVPGTVYRVIFQDAVQCAAVAHDDLAVAPSNSDDAPTCPVNC